MDAVRFPLVFERRGVCEVGWDCEGSAISPGDYRGQPDVFEDRRDMMGKCLGDRQLSGVEGTQCGEVGR